MSSLRAAEPATRVLLFSAPGRSPRAARAAGASGFAYKDWFFGADASQDLAQGKPVTASEAIEASGWSARYLTDGVTNTQNADAHGYTSQAHGSTDVSTVADLGHGRPRLGPIGQ